MTFKKWAWDIFETTGNLEAFLAIKEAETQEKKSFAKMEVGDIELTHINLENTNTINNDSKETQVNSDINGGNKN